MPTRVRCSFCIGKAALGFCVNLLTILTVKLTSSISFKLISMVRDRCEIARRSLLWSPRLLRPPDAQVRRAAAQAKNAAIVLISVPIFHNKISPTQALGYSVTVLGFGWYNYAKLQPWSSPHASSAAVASSSGTLAPRAEEYRPLAGDEKQLKSADDGIDDDDDDKDRGNGSDSESDANLVFPEFPELLATLPPSLRWLLESAMDLLVRWGLADAFSLTASLYAAVTVTRLKSSTDGLDWLTLPAAAIYCLLTCPHANAAARRRSR